MKTKREIIQEAVKIAVYRGGLSIGDTVCIETEQISRRLIAVEGLTAEVELPDGTRSFWPLSKCFDPNVAMSEALRLTAIQNTFNMN